jgi:hypothetical protein
MNPMLKPYLYEVLYGEMASEVTLLSLRRQKKIPSEAFFPSGQQ